MYASALVAMDSPPTYGLNTAGMGRPPRSEPRRSGLGRLGRDSAHLVQRVLCRVVGLEHRHRDLALVGEAPVDRPGVLPDLDDVAFDGRVLFEQRSKEVDLALEVWRAR